MTALTVVIDNPILFAASAVAAISAGTWIQGLIGNWLASRSPDNYWRNAYNRETSRQLKALEDGLCPACSRPLDDMPDPDPDDRLEQ